MRDRPFHPFHRYPGSLARTWRCPFHPAESLLLKHQLLILNRSRLSFAMNNGLVNGTETVAYFGSLLLLGNNLTRTSILRWRFYGKKNLPALGLLITLLIRLI